MNSNIPLGQERAWQTFLQAKKENRVGHAILLRGTAGIGKLPFAVSMAKTLNCTSPSEDGTFCNTCSNCQKIAKGIHPDVHFIFPILNKKANSTNHALSDDFMTEFRANFLQNPYLSLTEWSSIIESENKPISIFIHEIRELKKKMALKAFEGKTKIVILWNAEKINSEASNAFLKMLEEPPDNTYLILCVSDTNQLLSTINSRCQSIALQRLPLVVIENYLVTKFDLNPTYAQEIALLADGSIAKALEMKEHNNESYAEAFNSWINICYEGDFEKMQLWSEARTKTGKDSQKLFLNFSLQKLRDAMLFKLQLEDLLHLPEKELEFQKKFYRHIELNGIESMVKLIEESYYFLVRNGNSQMVFLVLTIKLNAILKHTYSLLETRSE